MSRQSLCGRRAATALLVVLTAIGTAARLDAQRVALPAADSLRAVRDSFAAVAPAGIVGTMRWTLARTASGGWRVSELISVDEVLELATISRVSAALRLEQFTQSGVAFGRDVLSELAVNRGRLQGQVLSPDGTRLATLDVAPPDGPDLTLLPALLTAVSWHDGATATWAMVRPASGTAVSVAVLCEGAESLSIRGTSLAAWRLRTTIGDQITRYWVSTTAPARVLAVSSEGLPFRFVAR